MNKSKWVRLIFVPTSQPWICFSNIFTAILIIYLFKKRSRHFPSYKLAISQFSSHKHAAQIRSNYCLLHGNYYFTRMRNFKHYASLSTECNFERGKKKKKKKWKEMESKKRKGKEKWNEIKTLPVGAWIRQFCQCNMTRLRKGGESLSKYPSIYDI